MSSSRVARLDARSFWQSLNSGKNRPFWLALLGRICKAYLEDCRSCAKLRVGLRIEVSISVEQWSVSTSGSWSESGRIPEEWMVTKILFASDFSVLSKSALFYTAELAR
jgi:hypothetical protein